MGTREEVLKLRNKWHIAFYGTRMQNIKTIMEAAGALKIPGTPLLVRKQILYSALHGMSVKISKLFLK